MKLLNILECSSSFIVGGGDMAGADLGSIKLAHGGSDWKEFLKYRPKKSGRFTESRRRPSVRAEGGTAPERLLANATTAKALLVRIGGVVEELGATVSPDWTHVGSMARIVEVLEDLNDAFSRDGE